VAVCGLETPQALSRAAAAAGRPATVHVKVDTGMGRVGVPPDDAVAYVEWLSGLPGLRVEGIFSHFAAADETDLGFSHRQLETFRTVLAALAERRLVPPLRHMANTAATMVLAGSHFDLLRTGIGIYGLYPSAETERTVDLEPAMRLVTRIAFLKEVGPGTSLSYGRTFTTRRPSRIATLPVGYGDGYPRLLSNRGAVLVGEQRVPIVGRVCMDLTLVDVTDAPAAREGDEVILFGARGAASISVDEIADLTGTINYEVACNVGRRVPRRYLPAQ